jgi:hypothetical protein
MKDPSEVLDLPQYRSPLGVALLSLGGLRHGLPAVHGVSSVL